MKSKLKKHILTLIFFIGIMSLLTACGEKVHTYNTEDYVAIVMHGINGDGRAEIFPDREKFYALIDNDLFDGKGTEVQLAQIEVNVYDSTDIIVNENTDGLSNGDKLTIKVTADNDRLKEHGIAFSENEYVYIVEGLEEAREIDLFSDIKITYEGVSPYAKAAVEYIGEDEFIKDHVNIFIPYPNNIANGDELEIQAIYSPFTAEENNVIIKEDETTVTVSGLDEYLDQKPEDGEAEMDKFLDDYIKKYISESDSFADGKEISSAYLLKDAPSTSNIYKILDLKNAEPIEKMVLTGNLYANHKNEYLIFYKLNFDIEKTENENEWIFGSGDDMYDGKEIGYKTVSDDVYYCVYLFDVIRKADGTIEYDTENYGRQYYGREVFLYNLTGKPYEDVREQFLKDNSSYEIVYSEKY